MKHLSRILSLLILVSAGLFFANCGGSEPKPKSTEETQLDKLKANDWKISTVDGPNGDVSTSYTGMTLTFTGSFSAGGQYNYSSTTPTIGTWPDANPWKADGLWEFNSSAIETTFIALDYNPDIPMAYSFQDGGNVLKIEFTSEGEIFTNGRSKSVDGDWTFTFEKD